MTTQSSTSETRARLTSARAQGHYVGTALLVASALFGSACGSIESGGAAPPTLDTAARDLLLDPEFEPENPLSRAQPASDYTLFEADPVRPIAVLPDSGLVAVANTADDFLELARPTGRGVQACGAIKVGMRPVAVALLNESQKDAELWVVNHLSDSISIVHIDPESCSGEVVETLFTGDEPRDIVVGRTHAGSARVFVTAAHRGQHHPDAAARLGKDLTAPAQLKANPGLADVFVFDPQNTAAPAAVINLFTDTPRALAVGDGVVYAAGFRTGNRSSVVHGERAAARGLSRLRELLAKDASGQFQEQNGELVLTESARGVERMQGGMPAVTGSGRCLPDPRPQLSDLFLQQVCVATDSRQHVQRVSLQREGTVDATCQCTSGDGTLQPTSSVIVKFFDRQQDCGQDFTTFPDGTRGCWLDAEPSGVRTPAAHGTDQAPPMAWNEDVKFSLPDNDVFAIGIDDLAVRRAFSGVGTVLFGMAVQPGTGRLFVTNTEAQNLTRFEGDGTSSSSTVLGHLHESRVTLIDPRNGRVQPVHLNSHVDYSRCCARKPGENESSFAFPTAAVFSPEGSRLYFSALGSDKIGIVRASALGAGFDNARARRRGELSDIVLGPSVEAPAGPVGLELDAARRRLYVKTHISNELVVIDTDSERVAARLALHTPEPSSIRAGRAVFYNARLTSSHGDSACASCHVFGDFDGISWDLGNPDGETVRNPGPFRVAPEVAGAKGLALDPLGKSIANRPLTPDFRSNKGPMNTQTLRGMANHGAQHWRGDRTRNFQDRTGTQPNFGSLNENDSFNEFDVAIAGLNGNDQELDAATFQSFTDFALQLTLPPNPVRALDDSLDAAQARARALFFGCSSLSDAQFEQRECLGSEGQLVDIDTETQACACASNPIVRALHGAPGVQRLASLLRAVLSDPALRAALVEQARNPAGLSVAGAAALPQLAAALASSIDGLLSADLSLHAKGLFSAQGAQALSDFSGAVLAIRQLPRDPAASSELLDVLVAVLPSGAPFQTGKQLGDAIGSAFAVANLDLRTVADEASGGAPSSATCSMIATRVWSTSASCASPTPCRPVTAATPSIRRATPSLTCTGPASSAAAANTRSRTRVRSSRCHTCGTSTKRSVCLAYRRSGSRSGSPCSGSGEAGFSRLKPSIKVRRCAASGCCTMALPIPWSAFTGPWSSWLQTAIRAPSTPFFPMTASAARASASSAQRHPTRSERWMQSCARRSSCVPPRGPCPTCASSIQRPRLASKRSPPSALRWQSRHLPAPLPARSCPPASSSARCWRAAHPMACARRAGCASERTWSPSCSPSTPT
jgi:DNA-binding beta-propeller fold protein YncE